MFCCNRTARLQRPIIWYQSLVTNCEVELKEGLLSNRQLMYHTVWCKQNGTVLGKLQTTVIILLPPFKQTIIVPNNTLRMSFTIMLKRFTMNVYSFCLFNFKVDGDLRKKLIT